ncbi:MAG: hypothetical protein ACI83P_000250 [Janthinobacterium sp.]|jgi:hypothetical protein
MQIALHVLELTTALNTPTAPLAHRIMAAQTGAQFSLELAMRMQVVRLADGLMKDCFCQVR